MFQETGEETLVKFEKGKEVLVVAVDDESYARLLNAGYRATEEMSRFTRLPPDDAHLFEGEEAR